MPDLPRRRGPQRPSWTQPIAQRLTQTIKILVVTQALLFFFYIFVARARLPMERHLGLGPLLFRGEIWQPLTALFVTFFRDIADLIFFGINLIGLWFVSLFIERVRGTRGYLMLFFGAGVLANLAIAGVGRLTGIQGPPFGGSSYALLALFVAVGRIYGRQPMPLFGGLVLQGRTVAIIFVLWALVAALWNLNWPHVAATLVATVVGFIGAAPGGLRELYDLFRARRLRRRYRVLDGGSPRRGRSPKYWN